MEQEIVALGQEWASAEQHGTVDFFTRTLTDDFIGVGPRGFLLTKAQWIARFQSGDLRYTSIVWDDVRVRTYGDTAIALGRETTQGTYKGHDISGELRTTQVFVRREGQWFLAAIHLSPIA